MEDSGRVYQKRLLQFAYYGCVIALFYFFMTYVFGLVFPFLFAFGVATVLQKPVAFACRKFRMKHGFAATSQVLLFYLLILLCIALVGGRIWKGAKDLMESLTTQLENLPGILEALVARVKSLTTWLSPSVQERFYPWMDRYIEQDKTELMKSIMAHVNFEWFRAPVSGVLSTAGKIPALILSIVITIISSFFMTGSYDTIVQFLERQLKPEQLHVLAATKRILKSSAARLFRSYALILTVTFVELCLGLLLLSFLGLLSGKNILGVALVIAVLDILPVLGVGSILVPWAVYRLFMGEVGLGIGLLVMWAVITVVRQIIEPKLVAANLGLPPIVTIAGMYLGIQLFGFAGLLILPMLLILLKLLNDEGVLRLWKPRRN